MTDDDDITKLLRENPPADRFTPYVHEHYSGVTAYWDGAADYSVEVVTGKLILYKSLETNEVVGCRILKTGANNAETE